MTDTSQPKPMPRLLIAIFCTSAVIALFGMDAGNFPLRVIFKTLTTALLFVALGRPDTPFRKKVALGVFFSLIGDIALLSDSAMAFMIGAAAFVFAHCSYIAAFLGAARRSVYPLLIGGSAAAVACVTVYLCFPGAAEQGMLVPVFIYAAALTTMVTAASATIGGPLRLAKLATVGAILFYIADSSLAVTTFIPDLHIPHPVLLTSGVYWVGQFFIVTAARSGLNDHSGSNQLKGKSVGPPGRQKPSDEQLTSMGI